MRINLLAGLLVLSLSQVIAGCGGGGGGDTGEDTAVNDTVVTDLASDSTVVPDVRDVVESPDSADSVVAPDIDDAVVLPDVANDLVVPDAVDAVETPDVADVVDSMSADNPDANNPDDVESPDTDDAATTDAAADVTGDVAGCQPNEFDCGDGTCINLAWKCDDIEDCLDGSDEEGCDCESDCFARECGPDPVCGVSCGTCDGALECGPNGLCAPAGMVKIPANNFWMGCNESADDECAASEKPYHQVTLGAYYMDRTEVTVDQYAACVDAGACTALFVNASCNAGLADHGTFPANCGTWDQAAAYCAWAGKQLPTEAQWERAARSADGRVFPWGNATATCDYAVMNDDSVGCGTFVTWPVCSKSPAGDSPYGLCDMAGNVAEWVADWYSETYYGVSPGISPTGPDSGTFRGMRGGGYMSGSIGVRTSARNFYQPNSINWDYGFRCAMPVM